MKKAARKARTAERLATKSRMSKAGIIHPSKTQQLLKRVTTKIAKPYHPPTVRNERQAMLSAQQRNALNKRRARNRRAREARRRAWRYQNAR